METEIRRRYFMAIYDSTSLSHNLERGLAELSSVQVGGR